MAVIMPEPAEIEKAFFIGMRNGYVTGLKGVPVRNMPGYRMVATKYGDWKVTDMWATIRHKEDSAGVTTVFYKNTPVWVMSYEGWYTGLYTISFLKKVLSNAYNNEEFYGCRGCPKYYEPFCGMEYTNTFRGRFKKFNGKESIKRIRDKEYMGEHTYRGGILF